MRLPFGGRGAAAAGSQDGSQAPPPPLSTSNRSSLLLNFCNKKRRTGAAKASPHQKRNHMLLAWREGGKGTLDASRPPNPSFTTVPNVSKGKLQQEFQMFSRGRCRLWMRPKFPPRPTPSAKSHDPCFRAGVCFFVVVCLFFFLVFCLFFSFFVFWWF